MTIFSGQTLKGYDIHECIGQGAFGAVFRAYQLIIDREMAIKVILPQYANQPDFIRRFETEAQLVVRLDAVPGLDARVIQGLIAELGTDMSRFPTAAHMVSWAGLAPGKNESAGRNR